VRVFTRVRNHVGMNHTNHPT